MKIIISALMLILMTCAAASAETAVEKAELCAAVEERLPVAPFSPQAGCVLGEPGEDNYAVVDSSGHEEVYLWTAVRSDMETTLLHTWYMESPGSMDPWVEMAQVSLNVFPSSYFRTKSSKKIEPSMHQGKWKVVVTSSDAPDVVLCTMYFQVN
jgi:hypothetical protein